MDGLIRPSPKDSNTQARRARGGDADRQAVARTGRLIAIAEVFAENDVDLEALRLLTDAELGEGRRISWPSQEAPQSHSRAERESSASAARPPVSRPNPAAQASASAEAERRQLTVMFCDLVGSTELAQRLDPEQLRDLMHAYQRACGGVIAQYDGHVAQYLGDGLMVYFGWPRAHEDDAERAVRAALDIVEIVRKVPAPDPLQVRVGVATGPVVVGETGGGDASVPKAAVGQTPNLAARMQGLAGPDQVVIAPTYAPTSRRYLRVRGPGRARAQGYPGDSARATHHQACARRESLRRHALGALHAVRGARAGDRPVAGPLGAGEQRRGSGGPAVR